MEDKWYMTLAELSGMQIDALKIGNIGAGNAFTALAQMINDKIDMSTRSQHTFCRGFQSGGGAGTHVVGIYLCVEDQPCSILFMMPIQACLLVDMLMGRTLALLRLIWRIWRYGYGGSR